jgi:hypothetical protein
MNLAPALRDGERPAGSPLLSRFDLDRGEDGGHGRCGLERLWEAGADRLEAGLDLRP